MTRRAYFYFVLTFLLGAAAGGGGVFAYVWYGGHWRQPRDRNHIIQSMKSDLNLSDSQVQQLTQIMDESGKKFRELRQQLDPQFAAVRKDSDDRIRAILNPEQQKKFDEIVRRFEEERARRRPPP